MTEPAVNTKRALIIGISGQDGAYLANFLLERGYTVYGTSRDAANCNRANLQALSLVNRVQIYSASIHDIHNLLKVIENIKPDEIYDLAGQSSVELSFHQPAETVESVAVGTIRVLEALRYLGLPVRFYNACSSECFGGAEEGLACDETTPFRPRSPYALAKSTAYWATANYREAYGLHACSGILFNHESPLRPDRFVIKKVVSTAVRIAKGETTKLTLGNIDVWRDWGYAPEYVEAMWIMLQEPTPDDFVIATGESYSLSMFVQQVFEMLGLRWEEHTIFDDSLRRPAEVKFSKGNPAKAERMLGWRATTRFHNLAEILVEAEKRKAGLN